MSRVSFSRCILFGAMNDIISHAHRRFDHASTNRAFSAASSEWSAMIERRPTIAQDFDGRRSDEQDLSRATVDRTLDARPGVTSEPLPVHAGGVTVRCTLIARNVLEDRFNARERFKKVEPRLRGDRHGSKRFSLGRRGWSSSATFGRSG
jgi:hypothetical protein